MASTKGLKPGDRRYNADTNEWEVKQKKKAPTPASNTRKKMARAAAAKKATAKPAAKKAPVPKTRPRPGGARPEGKAAGMPAAKKKPSGMPQAMFAVNSDGAGKTYDVKRGNVSRNLGKGEKYRVRSNQKVGKK
jgi:hypothetical protein